jgi:hypothetical protein
MRRDELYLADLVDNTRAIREYLDGISREQWDQDRVRRDAVVYRLLLLGETASALPDILRDRYPLRLRVGAGQESFHRVVQPVLRESPVFRYRGRGLPDHVRRDEHGIEVPGRPHGVIRDRQGSASNEEQLGSRPARRQFRGQVVEERADVLPPEAGTHARSSAPSVMKTPRRRNEDGDSTRARG